MPGRDPRPGDIYQHFKGNKYQVTAIAVDAGTLESVSYIRHFTVSLPHM